MARSRTDDLENDYGVRYQTAEAVRRRTGHHAIGIADGISDRGDASVHSMRSAPGSAQASPKGDKDIDRDLIVIEVPPGHRHRLKPIEFVAPSLGFSPVEELVSGHGWDAERGAHGVHSSKRRANCLFGSPALNSRQATGQDG